MSTKMTDEDWGLALRVFRASLPRRGAKGRNDRLFLEALHYFSVHNITWRALPERFGKCKANRQAAKDRGAIAVIPRKANEKNKPTRFAKTIYRARARIEQAVGKRKRFKRIALRCEKTSRNFASIIAIAAGFILIKSVHTA